MAGPSLAVRQECLTSSSLDVVDSTGPSHHAREPRFHDARTVGRHSRSDRAPGGPMRIAHAPEPTRRWTARTRPVVARSRVLMTSFAAEPFALPSALPRSLAELGGMRWYSLAVPPTITPRPGGRVEGANWSDHSGPRRPDRAWPRAG